MSVPLESLQWILENLSFALNTHLNALPNFPAGYTLSSPAEIKAVIWSSPKPCHSPLWAAVAQLPGCPVTVPLSKWFQLRDNRNHRGWLLEILMESCILLKCDSDRFWISSAIKMSLIGFLKKFQWFDFIFPTGYIWNPPRRAHKVNLLALVLFFIWPKRV